MAKVTIDQTVIVQTTSRQAVPVALTITVDGTSYYVALVGYKSTPGLRHGKPRVEVINGCHETIEERIYEADLHE